MHEDPADWMGRLMASPDTATHPFAQAYDHQYNAIRGMSILEVLERSLLEVGQREHQVLLGVRRQAAAIRKARTIQTNVVPSKDVQATAQENIPNRHTLLRAEDAQQLHFPEVHASAGNEPARPLVHGPPPAALAEESYTHRHAHRHSKESPVNKKRQRVDPGEETACKNKGSIYSFFSEQEKHDMRMAHALSMEKEKKTRAEKRASEAKEDTTRKKLEQNVRKNAVRWHERSCGFSRPTNRKHGRFWNTNIKLWSIQNHDASVNCLGHDRPAGIRDRAKLNVNLAQQTFVQKQQSKSLYVRDRVKRLCKEKFPDEAQGQENKNFRKVYNSMRSYMKTLVPSPVELNDDKQSGSTRSRGASVKLSTSVASTDTAMSLDVTCLVKRLCKEILPDEAQGQEHTNFQNVYNCMWPILNSLPRYKDVDMAAISENGMREDVHGLTKTMLTAIEREAASRAAAPIVVDSCTEFYERLPPSLLTNAGAPFSVKTAPSRGLVLRPTECQQGTVFGVTPPRVVVCSNLTS